MRKNNARFALGEVTEFIWPDPLQLAVGENIFIVRFDATIFERHSFFMQNLECPERVAASVQRRQAEFFWGRLCARAALERYGIARQVGIGPMREPMWPGSVVGSITHSRTLAAAVVLPAERYGGVGIDIEEVTRDITPTCLSGAIVSERELAYLRSVRNAPDLATLIILVFSAKESFFKAVFGLVNQFIDFDAIEIRHFDAERQLLTFVVMQALGVQFTVGQTCRIGYELLDAEHVMTLFAWPTGPHMPNAEFKE